jgi:DNA-3-methyladenine glycosylase I
MSLPLERCSWANTNPVMVEYHDTEWGVPLHDERKLFEFLILEGVQAGLSWNTVLQKRANYREVFSNFEVEKLINFTASDVDRLLLNPGIVRNRLKIEATIINAKKFIDVQREFDSFDKYIWGFVNSTPIKNNFKSLSEIPPYTLQSDVLSKDLQKRGFKFVGSTICYAFMQAIGMVNDHLSDCFRHEQV